ncbi:hypothetical protein SAMN02910447_02189 [Ruminococcus sp. YE71]|uniref:S-4TM family putative pore-forming effector n=1 Tax=unclassified Ruminococcus TaxID=2608920 RepID=UPI00088F56C2|nr:MULTISPECIES: S-4TM family putative pore-forming effector [unclassified Ruminococcus]SDA22617.1 hypothetical protein SAMN02910446_02057 [Ruminococcus sp. YE78]SFW38460.1 hypothetical protein SAMN02910447_02189 [Ruminococcus sp. YE71]
MINSQIISNRQNEDLLLKIQYASRRYFNSAEKFNYLSWVLCIASAAMIFVPDSAPELFSNGIPAVLEVFAFVTACIFNSKLKNAASLRNYFDSYVLMIDEDSYTNIHKQKLREIALATYNRYKKEADIHIHNTGRDKPPGVKNWYEFKNPVADRQAQFECQKQNIWWNKKMVKNRMILLSIILFILISFFVTMFALFKSDALSIIVCAIGIILKVVERIIEHYSYHKTSIKIEAIQSHAERELTAETVKELQELINGRREIPVLEINIIHKLKAKRYSSSYEETS